MSHESESNQDCCNLDMAKGLHQDKLYLNYPQKFMHAPKSCYPQKERAMKENVNAAKVMSEVCHAK